MPSDTLVSADDDALRAGVAGEYLALADLLEAAGPPVWDAPSLCQGWRTREVVAHVTMPVRYAGPAFMTELEAAGGDFTKLSNTVAARDGTLPAARLLADLRSAVLHGWQPPGGGMDGALTHCVIHGLDILESVPLARRVPDELIARVLSIVADPGAPNLFGLDLSGVALRADDLEWTYGTGAPLIGPAQALAVVACGRLLPAGRLRGEAAARFTQR
ncbi:MAG TPA: maleylpyruvate isomerase family mycothiol-dependent enzyme [Acidimicrobiales bacterium]|nr:maleylpyruvate isomerase family mycothiol-dependent enzyme [Acidimicrobiales bacterium]